GPVLQAAGAEIRGAPLHHGGLHPPDRGGGGPHRAHGHHPEGTHPAGRAHGRADRRLLGGVRPCRGGGQLGRRAGRVYILCAGRTQDRLHPGRGDRGPARRAGAAARGAPGVFYQPDGRGGSEMN
ncbi:mRNA interferase, partial [Dysosmobacter welbionis]